MPRDSFCPKNTAAYKHANVPRACQQHHGTHEKGHSDWNSVLRTCSAAYDFQTSHPGEDTERQRNQEHNPIETTGFPVSAPGGEPSRPDEIYGYNPAADVVRLMPHDCKVDSKDPHGEHGRNKDFSRQHMT